MQTIVQRLLSKKSETHTTANSEPEIIAGFRRKYAITLLILVAMVLGLVIIMVVSVSYSREYQIIQDSMKLAFKNPAASGGISIIGDKSTITKKSTSVSADNSKRKIVPVYVVKTTESGSVLSVESGKNIRMDDYILSEAIKEAIQSPVYSGYYSDYKIFYRIEETTSGYRIAFADGQRFIADLKSLIMLCLAGFVFIMLIFLFIALWISKLAVNPILEAWTTQKRFIADASHELKTPLSVILANADIMIKHPDDTIKDHQKWLETIRSETLNMQNLVDDLLTLSKLQSQASGGEMSDDIKRKLCVNLSEIAQKSSLQFEVLAFEKRVSLAESIDSNVQVAGSIEELERLVKILLDNACKYVNEGGSIQLSLEKLHNTCMLSVNNSGEPIPAEDLQNIFKRFYRSDSSRQRKNGGYGLGLAIAYEIVQKHGGIIRAMSTEEDGTSFFVELPLCKANNSSQD